MESLINEIFKTAYLPLFGLILTDVGLVAVMLYIATIVVFVGILLLFGSRNENRLNGFS